MDATRHRSALLSALAALDRVRAADEQARAAIDAALVELDGVEVSPPEIISIKEAARRSSKSVKTLKKWCDEYAIGHKQVGRWVIYTERLNDLMGR